MPLNVGILGISILAHSCIAPRKVVSICASSGTGSATGPSICLLAQARVHRQAGARVIPRSHRPLLDVHRFPAARRSTLSPQSTAPNHPRRPPAVLNGVHLPSLLSRPDPATARSLHTVPAPPPQATATAPGPQRAPGEAPCRHLHPALTPAAVPARFPTHHHRATAGAPARPGAPPPAPAAAQALSPPPLLTPRAPHIPPNPPPAPVGAPAIPQSHPTAQSPLPAPRPATPLLEARGRAQAPSERVSTGRPAGLTQRG
jgi:hypothetical protein